MSSFGIKKNMIKKNKFLEKQYGLFKSIVYRKMQIKYLTTHISRLILKCDNVVNKSDKILIAKEIFDYLDRSKDVWCFSNKFLETVRSKAFDLTNEIPEFQKYLISFGYICSYIKRDGNICGKRIDGKILCSMHTLCKNRLENRIEKNLQIIPPEILSIIFKYL